MAVADWLDTRKTSKNGQEMTFLILFLAIWGFRNLCFVHGEFRCHGIWGTGNNTSPYARLLKLYLWVVFLNTVKHVLLQLTKTRVRRRSDTNKFKFRALTYDSQ